MTAKQLELPILKMSTEKTRPPARAHCNLAKRKLRRREGPSRQLSLFNASFVERLVVERVLDVVRTLEAPYTECYGGGLDEKFFGEIERALLESLRRHFVAGDKNVVRMVPPRRKAWLNHHMANYFKEDSYLHEALWPLTMAGKVCIGDIVLMPIQELGNWVGENQLQHIRMRLREIDMDVGMTWPGWKSPVATGEAYSR